MIRKMLLPAVFITSLLGGCGDMPDTEELSAREMADDNSISFEVKKELMPPKDAFRLAQIYTYSAPKHKEKQKDEIYTKRLYLSSNPMDMRLIRVFDRGAGRRGFLLDRNRNGKLDDDTEVILDSDNGIYRFRYLDESEITDFYFKIEKDYLKASCAMWLTGTASIDNELYHVAFIDRSLDGKPGKGDVFMINREPIASGDKTSSVPHTFYQEHIIINEAIYNSKISFEIPNITLKKTELPTTRITFNPNFKKPLEDIKLYTQVSSPSSLYSGTGTLAEGVVIPDKKYQRVYLTLSKNGNTLLTVYGSLRPDMNIHNLKFAKPTLESTTSQRERNLIISIKTQSLDYNIINLPNFSDGKVIRVAPAITLARKSAPDVIIARAKTSYG